MLVIAYFTIKLPGVFFTEVTLTTALDAEEGPAVAAAAPAPVRPDGWQPLANRDFVEVGGEAVQVWIDKAS